MHAVEGLKCGLLSKVRVSDNVSLTAAQPLVCSSTLGKIQDTQAKIHRTPLNATGIGQGFHSLMTVTDSAGYASRPRRSYSLKSLKGVL